MKKTVAWLLTLTILLSTVPFVGISVAADTDDVWVYELMDEDGDAFMDCAILTGYTGNGGDVVIPDTLGGCPVKRIEEWVFSSKRNITSVTIPESVQTIGNYAFYNCTGLTSVTIPEGAATIGYGAFQECTSLTEITIPGSVTSIGDYAFYYCYGLTSATVSDGVQTIGQYAFQGCTGLTEITIPGSVTSIGNYAFYGCTGLTGVTLPSGITTIASGLFYGCTGLESFMIPKNVRTVNASAFSGCSSLKELTVEEGNPYFVVDGNCLIDSETNVLVMGLACSVLPEYVTSIGDSAFVNCTGLTEIVLPESVTSIGRNAFSDCSDLTKIELSENVTSIGGRAFSGCTSLTEIVLPESVTSIEWNAFSGCTNLKEIVLPENLTSIGWGAFQRCSSLTKIVIPENMDSIDFQMFSGCTGLTEVVLPDGLNYIGDDAFSGCTGLTEVVLPDGLHEIGYNSFSGCTSLTEITIPENVMRIGERAFYGCTSLTEITIPESVTSLGNYAFNGCSGLKTIYCEASEKPSGWDNNWRAGCRARTFWAGVEEEIDENEWYFMYEVDYKKEVTITKYTGDGGNVVIPETLGGYPVVKLGYQAFADCDTVTGVVFPASLTTIDSYVFYDCDSLKSITIPGTVTSIGRSAFNNCRQLAVVVICAGVETMGSWAIQSCYNLTDIYCEVSEKPDGWNASWVQWCDSAEVHWGVAPEDVPDFRFKYEIVDGEATLKKYNGLDEEVVIPSETDGYPVTKIADYAFQNCIGLTSVTIPSSVTSIGSYVFRDCTSLTTIYCEAEQKPAGWNSYWRVGCDATVYWAGVEEEEYERNYIYEIAENNEVTIIQYIGKGGDIEIPSEIGGYPVTVIGRQAFGGVLNNARLKVTGVKIPNSVTTIQQSAFNICWNLTWIEIPDSVTTIGDGAFAGCTGLTEIVLPNGVETIVDWAFQECTGLTEITIPESVTRMGGNVFYGCSSLTAIYCEASRRPSGWSSTWNAECDATVYYAGVEYIPDENAKYYTCTIENGEVTITRYLGQGGDVVIPDTLDGYPVTKIDRYAFRNCTSLTSVTIPGSVQMIETYAFRDCTSLTSVTFSDGVASMNIYAFYGCSGLTSVTIPASVVTLGSNIFFNCTSLETIYCEASAKPDGWDRNWRNGNDATVFWAGVEEVKYDYEIDDDGVTVTAYTGKGKEAVIPSEIEGYPVTKIGDNAFDGCSGLTSITIPDSVTWIGSFAFFHCSGLTSITIPESVSRLGSYAFAGCTSLETIYCEADMKPSGWEARWRLDCNAEVFWAGVEEDEIAKSYVYDIAEGVATIIRYTGEGGDVEIPSRIEGWSVIGIEDNAFNSRSDLTSITIPSGMMLIGSYAFAGCSNLTEITIPESVIQIGSNAFRNCSSLTAIYCEASRRPAEWSAAWNNGCDATVYYAGVEYVPDENAKYYNYTVDNGEAVITRYLGEGGDVVIPDTLDGYPVTGIESYAFRYNSRLTSVTIPESVAWVGNYVFAGCISLQAIYCEASEKPDGWNSYWRNDCDATVFWAGVEEEKYAYEIDDNGGATITQYTGKETDIVIPDTLGGYPVVAIGDWVFSNKRNITSVVIPESVKVIGYYAFYNCSGMTSVTIPEGVVSIGYAAFQNCSSLTEIAIPASVTTVWSYVFQDCTSLQSIYCEADKKPNGWISDWRVGCNATVYWAGVEEDEISKNYVYEINGDEVTIVKYIGQGGDVEIPSEIEGYPVTKIESSAFSGCRNLTSVTIPDSVTQIGNYAFRQCTSLTEITIPASVTTVWSYVFQSCTSLQTIYCEAEKKPEGWDSYWRVGCNAAVYWAGVEEDEIAKSYVYEIKDDKVTIIKYIGQGGDVVIPSEIEGYPVARIGEEAFADCYNLTSVVIPEGVTYIGWNAFAWCSGLTSVEIPESVTYIGWDAFSSCYGLTSIVIPNGVTEIGSNAFAWCENLTEITIPKSVTLIGHYVFEGCWNLTDIYCGASEKPSGWVENWLGECYATIHWSEKEEYLLGDVNADGVIDSWDYFAIKSIVLGMKQPTEEETVLADINRDGVVDSWDYFTVKEVVLGMVSYEDVIHR